MGLTLGVPSCPVPPGAHPEEVRELGQCQGGHFDRAVIRAPTAAGVTAVTEPVVPIAPPDARQYIVSAKPAAQAIRLVAVIARFVDRVAPSSAPAAAVAVVVVIVTWRSGRSGR